MQTLVVAPKSLKQIVVYTLYYFDLDSWWSIGIIYYLPYDLYDK